MESSRQPLEVGHLPVVQRPRAIRKVTNLGGADHKIACGRYRWTKSMGDLKIEDTNGTRRRGWRSLKYGLTAPVHSIPTAKYILLSL
ncbi:hypothetical protein PAXINDRAFT_104237 [Paxillus involutus ATCC 200175]|uniref:Uncharacterized protein n=1 Tax=Paxillus involutus ATCC 200175 TaxID=664439 RepID=A0A0C9T7N0_PAXIN|nr:hypothetical protein PAXINDRAFT_104237 [Paxillus involutus ATCC 200175]